MAFRLLFEEERDNRINLDQLEYEAWLEFVFNHPEPKKSEDRWYALAEAERYCFGDSARFLVRVTRLMREADLLLSRYSVAQCVQGFWCLVSAFELPDVLEDNSLPFESRRQCIAAVEDLYRRLFRRPGFQRIAFRYWDPLTYSFFNNQGKPLGADASRLQDALFQTLVNLLGHREHVVYLSALHGLGHLRHPRGAEAIQASLQSRNDLSIFEHVYAMSCIRGDMDVGPEPAFS